MKYNKLYEADDKMITLISDNYNILQSLGRFGISLGFGDKTVREVCEEQEVDTFTFLAIVNYTINGYRNVDSEERFSVPTLLHYLKSSHEYYLNFQLPAIRTQLQEALDMKDNLARLILKLYDGYAQEIRRHMQYEEKTVFPYVVDLLNNKINNNYDIDTFSKHHGQVDLRLKELKNIIIKYLPTDIRHNNQLTSILYNLYNNEEWLVNHSQVEEDIFIPAIRNLEHRTKQSGINANISRMINSQSATTEALSDREKDVVVSLVQGMSNKEIAEHLFISTNTVITHRRNIARKLQIHSPAGLTIYAIVNNLIDISAVKL
ncbi:MAG: LuxR C-terminal-related transcriptional regulator [Prevotella sp.]|nr:LuxR C-terminal-related transcriptional regulator [Paraprevotella sp.]MDD5856465.1 LuxR C-terminal-related transcriptional regulator [Prevotella sp.]MDD7691904.1 LuxR C-terminal-related transcriptional regulator [Prevotella sp.]MDY4407997.1 LuxR C-terminal-related transcriptional regulator [Prevotella sp.]